MVMNNGLNPAYNEEPFVFRKVARRAGEGLLGEGGSRGGGDNRYSDVKQMCWTHWNAVCIVIKATIFGQWESKEEEEEGTGEGQP